MLYKNFCILYVFYISFASICEKKNHRTFLFFHFDNIFKKKRIFYISFDEIVLDNCGFSYYIIRANTKGYEKKDKSNQTDQESIRPIIQYRQQKNRTKNKIYEFRHMISCDSYSENLFFITFCFFVFEDFKECFK